MTRNGGKAGRVALVTGAARGIGRAFAQRLARDGATVVAIDRNAADGVEDELIRCGAPQAIFASADVADEAQVTALARQVLNRFGRCDIVVNNAGIVPHGSILDCDLAAWRRTFAVNVDSMMLVCQAVLPPMIAQGHGRIVNITSDTLGAAVPGFSNYMASKGAVVGLTRALANEVGVHGVTVNCVAPGLTRTARTEAEVPDMAIFDRIAQAQAIRRHGVPDDLVGALSFLTSDDARFITGQTLVVNGGLLKAI